MEFCKLFRTVKKKQKKKQKIPNRDWEEQKMLWRDGYSTWTNEEFKNSLRMDRETFNFILCRIERGIIKEPTMMIPNPIEPHRQLALTIYRIAHGCSFKVLKYIFGVSQSLATQTFIKVIRVLILNLCDERIKLHSSEEEWVQECKSFIENYEFPCVGAWDGFHVNITTHLKNRYNFKINIPYQSWALLGITNIFYI